MTLLIGLLYPVFTQRMCPFNTLFSLAAAQQALMRHRGHQVRIAFSVAAAKKFHARRCNTASSPLALSHAIREREERMGGGLLSPTTRPVTPMRAAERRLKRPGFATERDSNAPR